MAAPTSYRVWGSAVSGVSAICNVSYAYKAAPDVDFANIKFKKLIPARGAWPNGKYTYAFSASVGVTPLEFCRDFRQQKTRVFGLSCGVVCLLLRLAVSVEHRLVTDGQPHDDS